MDSFSRSRKPASPSFSKMKAMSTPVRASMSASLSWKENRNSRARWRPTADLPEPMGPMRKTLGWESMAGKDTETQVRGRTRPPEGGREVRDRDEDQLIAVTGIETVVADLDSGRGHRDGDRCRCPLWSGGRPGQAQRVGATRFGGPVGPPPASQPMVKLVPVPVSVPTLAARCDRRAGRHRIAVLVHDANDCESRCSQRGRWRDSGRARVRDVADIRCAPRST